MTKLPYQRQTVLKEQSSRTGKNMWENVYISQHSLTSLEKKFLQNMVDNDDEPFLGFSEDDKNFMIHSTKNVNVMESIISSKEGLFDLAKSNKNIPLSLINKILTRNEGVLNLPYQKSIIDNYKNVLKEPQIKLLNPHVKTYLARETTNPGVLGIIAESLKEYDLMGSYVISNECITPKILLNLLFKGLSKSSQIIERLQPHHRQGLNKLQQKYGLEGLLDENRIVLLSYLVGKKVPPKEFVSLNGQNLPINILDEIF